MSQIQIEVCRLRIPDPVTRDRFERMMKRADELSFEAAKLRTQAWADYRRATGIKKREKVGPYA